LPGSPRRFGILGLFERGITGAAPYLTIAAIEAALALIMPNFIHRVVSAYAAGFALMYACESLRSPRAGGGRARGIGRLRLAAGSRFGKGVAIASPIGYGLTLALIQVEGMASWRHSLAMLIGEKPFLGASPWIGEALVGIAFLVSVGCCSVALPGSPGASHASRSGGRGGRQCGVVKAPGSRRG